MPCHIGPNIVICAAGEFTHLVEARCPWCCLGDDVVVAAFREIFGGYEAPDLVCGTCGQFWNPNPDYPLRKITEEQRDEHIALVRGMRENGIAVEQQGPLPSALT